MYNPTGNADIVRTAMSSSRVPETVAQDLARQLMHPHLGFVLFFCSAEYDLPLLAQSLKQYFGGVKMVGCTTAGEITPQGYGRNCVTAIGFHHRHFSVACGLIEEMERFSLIDAQQMVEQLIFECRTGSQAPINDHSFALTLLDGLSSREEVVLSALNAALGRIPHFGGSAGDDNNLKRTHVYFDGQFHTNAAVVVLVNTWLKFEVFTTHHILPRGEKLVVTAADSAARRVYELNAEPAAQAYADLIGIPVEDLTLEVFASNPLAVRINDRYYIRAIQKVNPDLSLDFYCAVEKGIVLSAMYPGAALPNLEEVFSGLEQRLGEPLVTIGCDCFIRRQENESTGIDESISAFFRQHRVIGFNTYGEQCNGLHLNQTFTGVAISRPDEGA